MHAFAGWLLDAAAAAAAERQPRTREGLRRRQIHRAEDLPSPEAGHHIGSGLVGLVLQARPLGLKARGSGAALLQHMGQLMGQQGIAAGGAGGVLLGAEHDIAAVGEGAGAEGAAEPGGLSAVVEPHLREGVCEGALEPPPLRSGKGYASAERRWSRRRRQGSAASPGLSAGQRFPQWQGGS